MSRPQTFFFRCPECKAEYLHTVDLSVSLDVPEGPECHCGAVMQPAKIPRLVIPKPGGDGHTYEVEELKHEPA